MFDSSKDHVFIGSRTFLFCSDDSDNGQFLVFFFFSEVFEGNIFQILQDIGKYEFGEINFLHGNDFHVFDVLEIRRFFLFRGRFVFRFFRFAFFALSGNFLSFFLFLLLSEQFLQRLYNLFMILSGQSSNVVFNFLGNNLIGWVLEKDVIELNKLLLDGFVFCGSSLIVDQFLGAFLCFCVELLVLSVLLVSELFNQVSFKRSHLEIEMTKGQIFNKDFELEVHGWFISMFPAHFQLIVLNAVLLILIGLVSI